MSMCDGCAWLESLDALPFCKNKRSSGDKVCERFYSLSDDTDNEVICTNCNRKKDPGKCWWCGQE